VGLVIIRSQATGAFEASRSAFKSPAAHQMAHFRGLSDSLGEQVLLSPAS
jgi:hypothetical protein